MGFINNLILFIGVTSGPVFANAATQVPQKIDPEAQLNQIIHDLDEIQNLGLHYIDVANVYFLKQAVTKPLESIQASKGAIKMETVDLYFAMIEVFENSHTMFDFIRTARNDRLINDALQVIDVLREQTGYNTQRHTRLVWNSLNQIQTAFMKLVQLEEVQPVLGPMVDDVNAMLAEALAWAANGDLPDGYNEGRYVSQKLRAIYPQLQRFSGSQSAFRYVMEIIGANEFLGRRSLEMHRRKE